MFRFGGGRQRGVGVITPMIGTIKKSTDDLDATFLAAY
jgi:hypothetical protein